MAAQGCQCLKCRLQQGFRNEQGPDRENDHMAETKKSAAKAPKATSEPAGEKPEAGKAGAKAASGKAAGKTVKPPKAGDKPNALQQKLTPSEALAAVVGEGTMPRGEVVSKVWTYIKAHKLQNPDDGREILADDTLRKVLGKDKVTMFEMNKLLAAHLK